MTRDTEQQLAPSDVTLATIDKLRQIANEIERGERRVCSTIIEEAPERSVQTHTFVTKALTESNDSRPCGEFFAADPDTFDAEPCALPAGHEGDHRREHGLPDCGHEGSLGHTCNLPAGHRGDHQERRVGKGLVGWANHEERLSVDPHRCTVCYAEFEGFTASIEHYRKTGHVVKPITEERFDDPTR